MNENGHNLHAHLYEQQVLNEEYKIWKKYTPFYYDLVITHLLEWPSLTVEWLPINEISDDSNYKVAKLVLGTFTSGNEPNYLMVAKVKIPKDNVCINIDEYTYSHQRKAGIQGIGQSCGNVEIEKRIFHEGEINRARHMPQNPNIITTKAVSGDLHIYDINLSYKNNELTKPERKLTGHSKEGFAVNWSGLKEGWIASGADDGKVLIWGGLDSTEYLVSPVLEYRHEGSVHDVCWNRVNENLLASVGSGGNICHWDIRAKSCVLEVQGSKQEIYSIDFNGQQEDIYLTGGEDKDIVMWDKRKPKERVKTFVHHEEAVSRVEWCPHNSLVFSSAAADHKVDIWDISKIGREQTAEEKLDGPPELLFIHAGHKSKVTDSSWHPSNELLIASVEEGQGNAINFWKMAKYLYEA